jgi:hypothetical protein
MNTKTQRDLILKHLMECRPITPMEAQYLYKCMRLGARIWELKQPQHGAHPIKTRMIALSSGKHVAEYTYDFSMSLGQPAAELAGATA